MKLTVLTWLKDWILPIIAKIIEVTFRCILFLLPLGVFMLLLQLRNKVSKVSNISVYTNDRSVWQFVFPGFLLVAVEPKIIPIKFMEKKLSFQNWVSRNKYLLTFLSMSIIVGLMILSYIKIGG